MKANMGTADRVIRTVLALAIGFLYYKDILPGIVGIVLLVLAVIFLATSFISFCPLYPIFGLSTKKKKAFNRQNIAAK